MMHMNVSILQDCIWKQRGHKLPITDARLKLAEGLLQSVYWSSTHCIKNQEKLIEISTILLSLNEDIVDVLKRTL